MKRGLLFVLPVLAAAFAACTTEVKEERQFVNLSQVVCSFYGEGNEPLAIEVKTSPAEWTVESGASWVTAERTDDRTLTVTVADNDASAERSATVTIAAGQAVQHIKVVQLAADSEFATYRLLETLSAGGVMSPNGKYIAGYAANFSDTDVTGFDYTVRFIDLDTGEVTEHGPYPKSIYDFFTAKAVTDSGVLFIHLGATGECITVDLEGTVTYIQKIAGYSGWPKVDRTTPDGKYWVGYVNNKDDKEPNGFYRPVLWTDGVPEILPMPEKNFRGYDFTTGIMARGISHDGSIIYGSTWENSDFGMVYWKKEGGEWKVSYAGEDVYRIHEEHFTDGKGDYNFADGLFVTAQGTCASPNGKWLASTYRTETMNESGTDWILERWPAFYNTETGKTTIVEEVPEGVGQCVTDDGIAFIAGPYGPAYLEGAVYDLNTNTYLGTVAEWVYDNYGIHIPSNAFVRYISPEGRLHGAYAIPDLMMGITLMSFYVNPLQ